jgi:hypothetical protein
MPNSNQSGDTTRVQDTQMRKSLPRRVSFAKRAHVRLFTKQNEQNTNSTESSQSSPTLNDENAYPGAEALCARCSLVRSSWGVESMDLEGDDTAPNLLDRSIPIESTIRGEVSTEWVRSGDGVGKEWVRSG